MSIIYDALEKLEGKGNSGDSSSQQKPNSNTAPVKGQPKLLTKKVIPISAGILIIAVLVFSLTLGRQILLQRISSFIFLVKQEYFADNQKPLGFQVPAPLKTNFGDQNSTAYHLNGIIYDSTSPVAIINGKALKKQDSVGEFRVAEITENSVELVSVEDDTKLTLKMDF